MHIETKVTLFNYALTNGKKDPNRQFGIVGLIIDGSPVRFFTDPTNAKITGCKALTAFQQSGDVQKCTAVINFRFGDKGVFADLVELK